ncbi:general secretion pathway protein GspE [Synechococcus sp. MU1643]|uniref:general secretion pathway protein GspE n=1 Tax=Synechococcus sp. MU1643 TaxID=2508349 RepID=UPI001CF878AC|nr:general secretion pathway protein GspE [Synechococcus sp. MU1643]MCB4428057.1 general secretion pathway protein GspE [Synechococcus sp. MU1643]
MTLTLPTPDAGNAARQRFALELLLQQRVPGPDQLLANRYLLAMYLPMFTVFDQIH